MPEVAELALADLDAKVYFVQPTIGTNYEVVDTP